MVPAAVLAGFDHDVVLSAWRPAFHSVPVCMVVILGLGASILFQNDGLR